MSPELPSSGIYVAAVTPHRQDDYESDVGRMLELVDFLAAAGVDGIALLGSTGEFLHFSIADRVRLVQLAVKRSRVPILVGVGHSTLSGAVSLAQEALRAGAHAVLSMPPYFFRYSQAEIREFYRQFAAAVGVPERIFLYNVPFFTNPIAVETAKELLSSGQCGGIKDSSGDFTYFEELLALSRNKSFCLFIGNDRIYTRARRAGAHGVVSGVACCVPELLVALERAIRNNLEVEIDRLERILQEFIGWHDRFPTPVAIKTAMELRGLSTGPLATPLSPETVKRLQEFSEWFNAWLPEVQKETPHV